MGGPGSGRAGSVYDSSTVLRLNGVELTLSQWAERTGIHRKTIAKRLELGWSVERALTTPARPYGRKS